MNDYMMRTKISRVDTLMNPHATFECLDLILLIEPENQVPTCNTYNKKNVTLI